MYLHNTAHLLSQLLSRLLLIKQYDIKGVDVNCAFLFLKHIRTVTSTLPTFKDLLPQFQSNMQNLLMCAHAAMQYILLLSVAGCRRSSSTLMIINDRLLVGDRM